MRVHACCICSYARARPTCLCHYTLLVHAKHCAPLHALHACRTAQVATPPQAQQLISGYERLVSEGGQSTGSSERGTTTTATSNAQPGATPTAGAAGMGRTYQVMVIASRAGLGGCVAGMEGGRVVEVEPRGRERPRRGAGTAGSGRS